eukprot:345704-Chlamydomonas_euryale.AAC.1
MGGDGEGLAADCQLRKRAKGWKGVRLRSNRGVRWWTGTQGLGRTGGGVGQITGRVGARWGRSMGEWVR